MAANKRLKKPASKSTSNRPKTDGFVSIHIKQAKASFKAIWHRPLGNILTLAVISMALAMPACLYLLGKNIAVATSHVTSPAQVSAYLREGVPEARVMVLKDELETQQDVELVEYISPQQGLEHLSQYSGFDQALSLLEDYALPGVLVITPAVEEKQRHQSVGTTTAPRRRHYGCASRRRLVNTVRCNKNGRDNYCHDLDTVNVGCCIFNRWQHLAL